MTATTASTSSGSPLQAPYVFSFMRRGGGGGPKSKQQQQPQQTTSTTEDATAGTATTTESSSTTTTTNPHPYENSIKTITTVATVEDFWDTYDFLKRPDDLPTTTDYHFFRAGIKPTWEDPSNAKGGKWIVRLPKGLASRYWEETVLSLMGGQLSFLANISDQEVCGAVLSIRYNEDILGVWNRTADNRDIVERIRDAVKKILQLPPHANMEYKPHQNSMQDRSSFRNTQLWNKEQHAGQHAHAHHHGSGGSGSGRSSQETAAPRRASSWAERGDAESRRKGAAAATRSSWRAAS